jgi:hypothetical protein
VIVLDLLHFVILTNRHIPPPEPNVIHLPVFRNDDSAVDSRRRDFTKRLHVVLIVGVLSVDSPPARIGGFISIAADYITLEKIVLINFKPGRPGKIVSY